MFVYRNSIVNYGGLSRNVEFYPGSDTYSGNGAIDYSNFGYYKPTKTYLPISYIIFENDNEPYDWAINTTVEVFEGTKTHSYMGMSNFTVSSSFLVRSAGYPGPVVKPSSLYEVLMWTSYPLENNVSVNGNTIYTNNITITGGNSGGPLYIVTSGVENGQPYYHSSIIGISTSSDVDYEYAYACRMRPVIINTYYTIMNLS